LPPAKSNASQASHDLVATEYTRRIYDELEHKPFDRTLLDRFVAALPRAAMVCDIGTGPGRVARYLHDRGVHVCGIDSSAAMVSRARQQNPGIEFRRGDIFALDIPDETFTAITGFYAFASVGRPDIVGALRELRRVLKTGGRLFLAFHIGDPEKRREEYWREEVSAYFYFFKTKEMKDYLKAAGFEMEAVVERDPYPDMEQQTRRGYIFARKPRPRPAPLPRLIQTELPF
jgi:ubiquinone/menaquinone biosynthesis C-methylase UbiE